jgi:hypothetical protein
MRQIERICKPAVVNNPNQSHVAKEPATLVLKLCLWSEGDIAVAVYQIQILRLNDKASDSSLDYDAQSSFQLEEPKKRWDLLDC